MAGGRVDGFDRGVGGQAAGSAGQGLRDVRSRGKVKVEGVAAHLGARRRGGILHEEVLGDIQGLAGRVGLCAEHERLAGDAVDLGRGVVNVDVDVGGAGCDALEVFGAVVDDVKQDLAAVGRVDVEAAGGVGG